MLKVASQSATETLRNFFRLESAGGLLLVAATVIALAVANFPPTLLWYERVLGLQLTVTLGGIGVDKPLLLWINDALMALFFMLVGLELKGAVLEGQLSTPKQIALPALGALGGVIVPAGIYWAFNAHSASQLTGWAIPTATDIAFALAVLSLLGTRVPLSLKLFLTTIAIVDDLAAIVLIATFYTSELSVTSLVFAGFGILGLSVLNQRGVVRLAPYMLIGLFIWFCVLKSGVHATLAGVVVAAFIPLRCHDGPSPARHLEHQLHPWVAFGILPIFAFANAGVSFQGLTWNDFFGGVPVGIAVGLFAGKQIGVFGMVACARLFRWAELPEGATWVQVYGVSGLCGIGFTMSLFIGSLSFDAAEFHLVSGVKVGVLCGSLVSAAIGLLILVAVLPKAGPESG